jgi:hypothetical protein
MPNKIKYFPFIHKERQHRPMKKSTIVLTVLLILSVILCSALFIAIGNLKVKLSDTTVQLTTTEGKLAAAETALTTTETRLSTSESQLATAKEDLENSEKELENTENTLKSTETQLVTANRQLEETRTQLVSVGGQLKTAQDTQAQMLDEYSDLRTQVNIRFGQTGDSQKFITPDNAKVAAKALAVAGNYSQDNNELWRDYKSLYQWVVSNIKYTKDSYSAYLPSQLGGEVLWSQECWRMPEETLADMAGDCEDMAVLLASLISNYNQQQYGVWTILIRNESQGHAAVAIPVAGGKLTILDPAGNYYTGCQASWLQSYDINQAVNDWLAYWTPEMPGAKVTFVFSHDFYQNFSSTQEFISWAKERSD